MLTLPGEDMGEVGRVLLNKISPQDGVHQEYTVLLHNTEKKECGRDMVNFVLQLAILKALS